MNFADAWIQAETRPDYHCPDWLRLRGTAAALGDRSVVEWMEFARRCPGPLHSSELGLDRSSYALERAQELRAQSVAICVDRTRERDEALALVKKLTEGLDRLIEP